MVLTKAGEQGPQQPWRQRPDMKPARALQETATEANNDEEASLGYRYWDSLRESGLPYESREGSAMFRINDAKLNETLRLAHIASVNPYSEIAPDGSRFLVDLVTYIEASAFLALQEFNERRSKVLPHLPDLLQDCNIYMTVDVIDTLLSPIVASQKVVELLTLREGSLREPIPLSLAGAARSAVSQPLAVLAGVYQIPMMNGVSTSSALDQKDSSPTFVRTAPNNKLDAQAVITYLQSLNVTHFGALGVRDAYGVEFIRDLKDTATKYNMTIVSASYAEGNEQEIATAVRTLQQSEFRYFFAAITPSATECKLIVQNALHLGIAGTPDYLWLWPETNLYERGFYDTTLDSSLESDREIARAISGMGMIFIDIPGNERFDAALTEMGSNQELFDYFVSRHDAPEVFEGFDWKPRPFFYQYLSYDYIMALGIGLCGMKQDFPTGPEIVDAVKSTEFLGVSGPVSFDPTTGTRTADSVRFKLVNIVVRIQDDSIEPEYFDSALINGGTGEVEILTPYVYSQGATIPPPSLPPQALNPNLIDNGARIAGWCLAGIVVLLSVGFGVWTYKNRDKNVIRVAQPFFLDLLCIGTCLMATTIIPLSLQEPIPNRGLDIACMSIPWIFVMGFSTAFSSLLCKTLRLNKLFRLSAGMRRVEVKVKDVVWPFVILLVVNFSLLLAWTLVAPLEWSRVEVENYDKFERKVESYGSCFAVGESDYTSTQITERNAFLVTLCIFNFGAVVLANYESYRARRVPSDFNESYYLALSMVSILEGFLIGVPILFLAIGTPTVFFVVASLLISFLCIAILLPTFVPKVILRRRKTGLRVSQWHQNWASYDKKRKGSSGVASGANSREGSIKLRTPSQGSVAEIRARAAAADRASEQETSSELMERPVPSGNRETVADIRARAAEAARLAGATTNHGKRNGSTGAEPPV